MSKVQIPSKKDIRDRAKRVRKAVYKAIDGERAYQLRRYGYRTKPGKQLLEIQKPVESYILYMEEHLAEARKLVSSCTDDVDARKEIRKVIALGVCCLEQNGITPRNMDFGVTNARDGHDA